MLGLSFKSGTDDLRESPLVMVAKRLLGEGCEMRIFDPEVQLSRLLGANRSYIEAHIPHLGSLLCDDIGDMIDPSEVILVGLQQAALDDALQARRASRALPDRSCQPAQSRSAAMPLRGHLLVAVAVASGSGSSS